MAYGQNDTGMLGGKEPFAEHSIATCKGSSGAPIFFYIFNHDTGEVDVDEAVYFLHFHGEEIDGKLRGKAQCHFLPLSEIFSCKLLIRN